MLQTRCIHTAEKKDKLRYDGRENALLSFIKCIKTAANKGAYTIIGKQVRAMKPIVGLVVKV